MKKGTQKETQKKENLKLWTKKDFRFAKKCEIESIKNEANTNKKRIREQIESLKFDLKILKVNTFESIHKVGKRTYKQRIEKQRKTAEEHNWGVIENKDSKLIG